MVPVFLKLVLLFDRILSGTQMTLFRREFCLNALASTQFSSEFFYAI